MRLSNLAQPAIPALALPAIQTFTSAADILTIISEEDELESGTQYQAQVRYETTGGDFSNWSDPVSFTTDIDTDYQVDLSGNVSFEFTAGEPRFLTVNVSNEGTDAGHPKLQLRLPFNVLDGLDGTVSDFYSISGCGSSVVINGGASVVSCDLAELGAESSVDVTATLTLKEGVDVIEYRVCEQDLCDEVPYESLAVSVVAGVPPPTPGGSSISSSSSGGAFWYLLLGLPVLGIFRKS